MRFVVPSATAGRRQVKMPLFEAMAASLGAEVKAECQLPDWIIVGGGIRKGHNLADVDNIIPGMGKKRRQNHHRETIRCAEVGGSSASVIVTVQNPVPATTPPTAQITSPTDGSTITL